MTEQYDGLGFILRQNDKWWLCRSSSNNATAYVKLDERSVKSITDADENAFNPWQPLALGNVGPIDKSNYVVGFSRVRGLENFMIQNHKIVGEQKDKFFGKISGIILADVATAHEDEAFEADSFEFRLFTKQALQEMHQNMSDSDYRKVYFEIMISEPS